MRWLVGERLWGRISGFFLEVLGIQPEFLQKVTDTVLAILFFVAAQRLLSRLVRRRFDDPLRRYTIGRTVNYVLGVVAVLIVSKIWLLNQVNLATYLGIVSAGLAIALQDPISNLAGWLFILLRQPFRVGDRIQIGKQHGDVVELRLLTFSLVEIGNWVDGDQSTGRILHLPNGRVFKEPVANYTQGFEYIWHEVPVMVTFESDWEKAHDILTHILDTHAEKLDEKVSQQMEETAASYNITFRHLTPIVWTKVASSGIILTLRFLCHARRRRSTESAMWVAILRAFAKEPAIDFAYPTQRFYNMPAEGKHAVVVEPHAQVNASAEHDDDDIAPKKTGKFTVEGIAVAAKAAKPH
jgi:small-conductance mechanosensitive channel